MYEPEVYPVEPEEPEAGLDRRALAPRVAGRQLRGDEDISRRDAAVVQGPSDLGLVPVHRRRVDKPVADVECSPNGPVGLRSPELPGSEAEQRHRPPTRQRDGSVRRLRHSKMNPLAVACHRLDRSPLGLARAQGLTAAAYSAPLGTPHPGVRIEGREATDRFAIAPGSIASADTGSSSSALLSLPMRPSPLTVDHALTAAQASVFERLGQLCRESLIAG